MNKLEKRFINGIEVTLGSGNVFADLGLPNADKLLIKSGLVIEITRAIRQLGITLEEAANRLGYDIEIKCKPSKKPVGNLKLLMA
jgi:hypothetical protein